jgi:hypothetical protein
LVREWSVHESSSGLADEVFGSTDPEGLRAALIEAR